MIFCFVSGHEHVVLTEGDAGLVRVMEAKVHDPVAENDRLFLAARTVNRIDDACDILLG